MGKYISRMIAISLLALATITTSAAAAGQGIQGSRAPLRAGQDVGWTHAPFGAGACSICHEKDDPKAAGPITMDVNDLCFNCHDQVAEMMSTLPNLHAPAAEKCTNCHNPHNAANRALLVANVPDLCFGCHDDIERLATGSSVRHGALTSEQSCSNCHNPHATRVDRMLKQLPYDLCVDCHGRDDFKDNQGRPMTNIKSLVDASHMLHGPVAAKDCSACHQVHGGQNFRLLVQEYPARFYAPWEPKNYALCFECHEGEMFNEAQTTTLTRFRDGDRNLHYVHVHKDRRGRTCRACHDVHGSPQDHLIRDGVPYGKGGWVLKINYTKNETGGSCAKTCHGAKTYSRKGGMSQ